MPRRWTNEWQRLADRLHLPREAIETVWSLIGTRTETVLDELAREASDKSAIWLPISRCRAASFAG